MRSHPTQAKRDRGWAVALCAAVLSHGCAMGNRHAYHTTVAALRVSGTDTIAIATHDQRPYVRNGDKHPEFVGLQRGGYGNPFNVTTESGRPLADDMTDCIGASLAARGFRVTPVATSPQEDLATVDRRLLEPHPARALLLVLSDWKADSMQNTALIYAVTLRVFDRDGRLLAEKNLIGKDNLGGSVWDPAAHARESIPAAFKDKLETLLKSPEVVAAFEVAGH